MKILPSDNDELFGRRYQRRSMANSAPFVMLVILAAAIIMTGAIVRFVCDESRLVAQVIIIAGSVMLGVVNVVRLLIWSAESSRSGSDDHANTEGE